MRTWFIVAVFLPEISSLVMSSSTIQVTSSIEISFQNNQNTTKSFVGK